MSDWRNFINDHYSELTTISALCRTVGLPDPLAIMHWIDADPDEIRAAGKQIAKIGGKHQGVADSLRKELGDVDAFWEGRGAQAFVTEYIPGFEAKIEEVVKRCNTQSDIAKTLANKIEDTQDKVVSAFKEAILLAGGAVGLSAALAAPTGGASMVLGIIASAIAIAVGAIMMLKDQLTMLVDLEGEHKFEGVGAVNFKLPKFATESGWNLDPDSE